LATAVELPEMPARRPEIALPAAPPAFERTTLPSGVRVLSETIPSVRSISVGVWVNAGSRDEAPEEGGITHFLEHLVFKGTAHRRGYQINQRMEAVGGYLNAFTTKEHTCFYARGLDEHLPRALDTVLDLVVAPTLPPKEVEKEKEVVVEEIKMYEDSPDDHVFDFYEAAVYPGHPLGRPIIGTPESVRSFTPAHVRGYLEQHYAPDQLVVAVAGNVGHDRVVRETEKLLDGFARAPFTPERTAPAVYAPSDQVLAKPIQQAHLVIGAPAWGALDPRRTVLSLLHTVLGGGMSSRLNQNIREKYGYCYSVYSFVNQQEDSGDVGVYIGVDAGKVDRARKLVGRELDRLAAEAVSPQMLARAKQQLKGSLMLGLESMSNRMQRLGRVELTFGRYVSLDEVIDEVEAVTAEEVRAAAEELFAPARLSSVVFVPEKADA
jgi:predicted Zn-dependent peptidase